MFLLKRHNRSNKYHALVQEINLIEANPQYSRVRHPNGREDTVATKYLGPVGKLLLHASLDQQSPYAENMDDVEHKQDNKKERAPTPSIRDHKVTLSGVTHNDIPHINCRNLKMYSTRIYL